MRFRLPLLLIFALLVNAAQAASSVHDYNVIWDSPSKDHHGSMPLGNGDIGANVWMSADGDLHCYISKTDAWDDNARLIKIGKVRLRFEPNLLKRNQPFRQELNLKQGTIVISTGRNSSITRIWVDANHPVIHVSTETKEPVAVTAQVELWRTNRQEITELQVSDVLTNQKLPDGQKPKLVTEPDTLLSAQAGRIGWFHHNVKSVGPALMAEIQGLTGFSHPDPLLHRTFGAVITAPNARTLDDSRLHAPAAKLHEFSILVLTRHPSTPEQWLKDADELAHQVQSESFKKRRSAHLEWWAQFWERSWIRAETGKNTRASAITSIVPSNSHPVHIGMDQEGDNRFSGDLGRVSLFLRPLAEDEVKGLATRKHTEELSPSSDMAWCALQTVPQALSDTHSLSFLKGVTIEAWVNPAQLPAGGGRILDKITPGQSDGFLLDTFPGSSLRFICGETILQAKDVLRSGQWTHVAAVADSAAKACRLYVNGRSVSESGGVVVTDEAAYVSQMYHLQRFITACAGRGQYPIKFNGSLFTVPPGNSEADPDYRRWGPGYWWQNTRLPYISLCTSGDFDLQQPLFKMYAHDLLPVCKYRTQHYLGREGAFYPECLMFWGSIFSETYGWTPFEERQDKLQESGWHKWEWVSGPELSWMMLDYYDHTRDESFLHHTLLPFTREILTFFEQHYPTNSQGKLVFHPSQALETWWHCTNSSPEVTGCIAVAERLSELASKHLSEEYREFLFQFLQKLPPIPVREVQGGVALAPAAFFAQKSNIENPELYPVFPFRRFAFNRPNADWATRALEHRWDRGNFGWRQDEVFMAYLGLSEDARKFLVGRARNHDRQERFPAFWGPNYDWTPDQDHGGILMKAFQAMLLQTDGSKIFLLPAWPKSWDVTFKLHAPQATVVSGRVKNGELQGLRVRPASRLADVVICR